MMHKPHLHQPWRLDRCNPFIHSLMQHDRRSLSSQATVHYMFDYPGRRDSPVVYTVSAHGAADISRHIHNLLSLALGKAIFLGVCHLRPEHTYQSTY